MCWILKFIKANNTEAFEEFLNLSAEYLEIYNMFSALNHPDMHCRPNVVKV